MNASEIITPSTKGTRMRIPSLISQCESWIESNPCPPNEDGAPRVAHWIYKAVLAFKLRRLSRDTAHSLIERHMTREPRPGEIEQAIERAYEQEFNGSRPKKAEPEAQYDPEKPLGLRTGSTSLSRRDGWRLARLGVATTVRRPDSFTLCTNQGSVYGLE